MPPSNPHVTPTCVCWITSLAQEDSGISRRIREDLEPLLATHGVPLLLHQPADADGFLSALECIESIALAGGRPFIHFDAHGDEETGLQIAATGESISWSVLATQLRRINVPTRNNLIVLSAVCFGLRSARSVDVEQPSPFYLLMAPAEKVNSGFLEDNMVAFYRAIFGGQELGEAFGKFLASRFSLFHCELLLRELFVAYVRAYGVGKEAKRRREELYTVLKSDLPLINREARRLAREHVKSFARADTEMLKRFERFSARFMIDRPISFDMQSVLKIARERHGK
jgi:hypothetical protein